MLSKVEDQFGGNGHVYSAINVREGGAAADADSREYGRDGAEGDCEGVIQFDEKVQAPVPPLLSLYLHSGGPHVHIYCALTP